ncbi:uncharacterized protein BDZ99DRAFT_524107 [Mytilinidion resinicola]|uniref:Uncharacterized protein n=1 Tax=Mytilinidion resinicola TaxID=574789 RepID=A0A6A6YCW7_9PEZI|nr:uncharacterized protein BDZ99DRAFT_524107 [Mytilinidion resinicola]KAF2805864.1 hypothetical protein BDZ99DRAFT_524107 [Mytilinidion resinicola]
MATPASRLSFAIGLRILHRSGEVLAGHILSSWDFLVSKWTQKSSHQQASLATNLLDTAFSTSPHRTETRALFGVIMRALFVPMAALASLILRDRAQQVLARLGQLHNQPPHIQNTLYLPPDTSKLRHA